LDDFVKDGVVLEIFDFDSLATNLAIYFLVECILVGYIVDDILFSINTISTFTFCVSKDIPELIGGEVFDW